MAADEASFSTDMLSMSAGFNTLNASFVGMPSMTNSGLLSFTEPTPRIRTATPSPGAPVDCVTRTPDDLPCNAWSILATGRRAMSLAVIVETAPVRSLRFWAPYPTTITSLRVLLSSVSVTSMAVWLPTGTSFPT